MTQKHTFPPWEAIKEILDREGLSLEWFRENLSPHQYDLESLITGDLKINDKLALLLEGLFAVPRGFWINLENNYRKYLAS
jgi:plasmid maintenance system antidote protein VapI